MNEKVLYNSYEGYDFETYKEMYADIYGIEPTEQDVWCYISEQEQQDWQDVVGILNSFEGPWIVKGHAGLWNGRREAMNSFESAEQMLQKITKDCEYIKVWIDNGHTYIKASHHDGTHEFEMKLLTIDGIDELEKYKCDYADYEGVTTYQMYELLWDNEKYSKLLDIEL